MTGLRIVLALLAVALAALVYVLLPSDTDLERRNEPIVENRKVLEEVLADCAELIHYFDRLKPTQRKKQELGDLRQRLTSLDEAAKEFRENAGLERRERKLGLDDLGDQYYELRRDAEDLRARLREMRSYQERRDPLMARQGRLLRRLYEVQSESTDLSFQQRSNQLIDDARSYRHLAETAMQELAFSIVKGRPIAESSLRKIEEINAAIEELITSVGAELELDEEPP
jgi:hypothetical protein